MAKAQDKKPAPSSNALKSMWDWLTTKYEFKRDIVKGRVLFREIDSKEKKFKVLEDEDLNTMSLDMALSGYKSCLPANILPFLYSHYTEASNPIEEYLLKVARRRPTGAIDKLADTIKTTAPALWKKYLKKWLVGSVANVMTKYGCQNHTCLTLTGGQGKGKSTWLNKLCPPELTPDYIFAGELDLKKKADTIWKLAEYWIVNIEEQIKGLNNADANYMKTIISQHDIKGRKPYGRLDKFGYRIANFTASTNDDDFLTDPSGSRRYLCFKVLDIDYSHKGVKIDEVWAEAFHLFADKNFEYWVSSQDMDELNENNKHFASVTQEYEYITQYFSKPNDKIKLTHIVPSTIIRDFIKSETGNPLLKEKNIGTALKSLGFDQTTHRFEHTSYPVKAWRLHLLKATQNSIINQYLITANDLMHAN